ncbi:MAG: YggS family pyridoxal phosphate-dependent enzyme [bacterium]
MTAQQSSLVKLQNQIQHIADKCHRQAKDITLLAVSKKHSANKIQTLYQQGQRDFGESYVQEAVQKIKDLNQPDISWHFIGPIQSNKTRLIAENFSWIHSIDRLKILQRISEQRPHHLKPVNICIQVNLANEAQKAGCVPEKVNELVQQTVLLDNIALRGIMIIPPKTNSYQEQKHWFDQAHKLYTNLRQSHANIDTLSMGMSADLEAAICAGSTIVRIGTALFGPREY